jgi:hypothetical protein
MIFFRILGEGPPVQCREDHVQGRQEYLRIDRQAGNRVQARHLGYHSGNPKYESMEIFNPAEKA